MMKTIKRILLGVLSVLLFSFGLYTLALLNPSLLYAHSTQFDMVTVYHNETLPTSTKSILNNAIEIIKSSEIYDETVNFQLCMNDGSIFPKLHPFCGGIAYSFLNKSVIYESEPDFDQNVSNYQWEVNENELRSANLTWLLAHEFTHNLQFNADLWFPTKVDFWQQEGYAEYISRQWKNDGRLKQKIQILLEEEQKTHIGFPQFKLSDGTVQMLNYYKYGLMVQYLVEVKNMDFKSICDAKDLDFDTVFNEVLVFAEQK